MLRRYAAGSSFGSGGAGRVMSDTEGEVKADPFGGWVMDGDLIEDDCDALVSRSPFPSVLPCPVSLELFRWNKRISATDQALR